MRKFYFILSFVLVFFSLSSFADGIHVGYCDGQIANSSTGTVSGMSGSNATISEAVFITPAMLQAYTSCQITSIYAGLAEGAANYPDAVTAWVRTAKDGENITSGTASPAGGWTTVMLDNAINVSDYAETGLWIGFSFKQSKKFNVLAFLPLDETIENTGWVAKNDKWTDYSSKGVLPIEAIVEGDGLPQRDLSIVKAVASPKIVKIGEPVKLKVTVKNNALVTAENPVIKYSIANGAITGSYTIDASLAYRDKMTVLVEIPSSVITEEMDATADLELVWADGTPDDAQADNKATVNFTFAKTVFYRTMLCEEATGSWCGYCVRGIVGLRYMRENYPDRFIGIGVHNSDEYEVDAYDSWIGNYITGYPECLINREPNYYDPSASELEAYYQEMEEVATAGVSVSGKVENGQLTINSNTTFAQNEEGTAYKMVYVVREDQCPISQHNYYSGGSLGEMGGFEDMDNPCDILINDVARAVYPTPAGEDIGAPASITKGTVVENTLTVDAPEVTNQANTCIIAILIDSSTGMVVNAAEGVIENWTDGIQEINANVNANSNIYYNVAGQRVSENHKGITIINGKKILK